MEGTACGGDSSGGHRDQIKDHRTGLLIDDPTDLRAFGAAIDELLDDPTQAKALASAGREHVRQHFLADRHFVQWVTCCARFSRRRLHRSDEEDRERTGQREDDPRWGRHAENEPDSLWINARLLLASRPSLGTGLGSTTSEPWPTAPGPKRLS